MHQVTSASINQDVAMAAMLYIQDGLLLSGFVTMNDRDLVIHFI